MKKRKIHRPGVPELTAQNEQGEDEGIGVDGLVRFAFPRNAEMRVKAVGTWEFSKVLRGRIRILNRADKDTFVGNTCRI
mgnify:CR=1 FL=1